MTAMPRPLRHQRAHGAAAATFARRDGRTVLRDLRQAGSARAIVLPGTEVVFLNTAGGLTGGDRLDYAVELGDGARVVATTQTAERVYRSAGGRARVEVRMTVGAGGHLDWLPQETILFDGAAIDRRTMIELSGDAACLALESVVLGRAAMGETVRGLWLGDRREIRRDGRPVMLEPLRLDTSALTSGPAVLGDARAFASLVLVAPGAGDALGAARAALGVDGVVGGASALEGRLSVRLMAADGWPLRRQIARLLSVLRRAPPPRVWQRQEGAA